MTFVDRQHSLTIRFVFMVSVVNIHESTTCTTRTNRHTTTEVSSLKVVKQYLSLPNDIHG